MLFAMCLMVAQLFEIFNVAYTHANDQEEADVGCWMNFLIELISSECLKRCFECTIVHTALFIRTRILKLKLGDFRILAIVSISIVLLYCQYVNRIVQLLSKIIWNCNNLFSLLTGQEPSYHSIRKKLCKTRISKFISLWMWYPISKYQTPLVSCDEHAPTHTHTYSKESMVPDHEYITLLR